MPDKEYFNPGIPVAGPYTPGVKVGNLLFISGQGPKKGTDNIKDQTYTTLENIKAIVEVAGGKVSDIVNVKVYLREMKDFGEMNEIYRKFFEENNVTDNFPARSTIEISNLPVNGMLIEIDAIAVLK